MDTATALQRFRRDYQLTQQQAADLLQVSLTTYHRWERKRVVPPYRERQRVFATIDELDRGRARGMVLLRA